MPAADEMLRSASNIRRPGVANEVKSASDDFERTIAKVAFYRKAPDGLVLDFDNMTGG